jgi:phage gp29-like protein
MYGDDDTRVGIVTADDAEKIIEALKGELVEMPLDREARNEYLAADKTGPAAVFQRYGRVAAGILANPFDTLVAKDKLERHASPYAAMRTMESEDLVISALTNFAYEAVLALPDTIEPAEGGQAEFELVMDWITERPEEWDKGRRLVISAVGEGFKTAEFIYDEHPNGYWYWPERVAERPQEYFGYNVHGEFCGAAKIGEYEVGEKLDAAKFFDSTYRATDIFPYGKGFHEANFWPWVLKRAALALWGDYLDRYAHGIFHGKAGTPADRKELETFFKNLGRRRGVATDLGAEIAVLNPRLGGGGVYESFLTYLDQKISINITGQTLATSEGQRVGSLALGQVHQDSFGLKTVGNARYTVPRIHDFLRRILLPSFHKPRVPIYRMNARPAEDLGERVVVDKTLYEIGQVDFPADYWYSTYGIPKPKGVATPDAAAARLSVTVDRRIPKAVNVDKGEKYGPGIIRLAKKRDIREIYEAKVRTARKMERLLDRVEERGLVLAKSGLESMKGEVLGAVKDARTTKRARRQLNELRDRPPAAWANGVLQALMVAYGLGWYSRGREVMQQGRFAADDFAVITTAAEGYDSWGDILDAYGNKLPVNAERFYEVEAEVRAGLWTVAKTKSLAVIGQMQDLVARAETEGMFYADVEAEAEAIYGAAGLDPLRPWHLQQMLRTNTSITYGAASEEFLEDPNVQEMMAGVMSITAGDDVVRPNHAALDGYVFTIEVMDREGLWKPLGFNCRCSDAFVGKGEATARLSVPTGGGPDPGPKTAPTLWQQKPSEMLGAGLRLY